MKKNYFLLSFFLFLFYSCNDDNFDVIHESSENYNMTGKFGNLNLFNEILEKNSKINLYEFTDFLNEIGFNEISILEIDNVNRSLKFSVNTNRIYVNTLYININTLEFTLQEKNGFFVISDNEDFAVKYLQSSKKFFLNDDDKIIEFDNLTDNDIENSKNIKKYPIYIGILENFINSVDRSENEDILGRQEGTAVGFHKSRANAEYFCSRDYQQILTDHSTWCSPGVSISCLWDNHLCVCTAEFYSGTDCTS